MWASRIRRILKFLGKKLRNELFRSEIMIFLKENGMAEVIKETTYACKQFVRLGL